MPDMNDLDSATLARIDERTQSHGTAFAQHVKDDQEKFEKVFNFVSKRFDKMDEKFDKLDEKIGTLWDEKNKRSGAFSASKLMSQGVWAVVVLGISYFLPGNSK